MSKTKITISFTGFATMLSLSSPAYAYLDPATGSILLQALIGAVAGATLFFRTSVYRIKEFLRFGAKNRAAGDE